MRNYRIDRIQVLIQAKPNLFKLGMDENGVRCPSVNLSPTLSKNEKVKQYIEKKTHKLNVLRFLIERWFTYPCMHTHLN